jgi:hypothetical protein
MLHSSVRELVAHRYSAVHGASPSIDYPAYCVVAGRAGPRATLGFRRASEGPLFLETYLDESVEAVLSDRLGRSVDRASIVEIGDHASYQPLATLQLWAAAARILAVEAEIAVAVLTAPLRRMFLRLGLPIVELAPALPGRLGAEALAWGRYYDLDPVVCAGEIETARSVLSSWIEQRKLAA